MRVKHVWDYLPLPSKVKLVWDRLTFSRLTTIYIVFSILHCMIQAGLQISAFAVNADAAAFLYNLAKQGNATTDVGVPALGPNEIRICPDVPVNAQSWDKCETIWNGTAVNNVLGPSSTSSASTDVAPTASAVNLGAMGMVFPSSVPSIASPAAVSSFTTSEVFTRTVVIVQTPPPKPTNVDNVGGLSPFVSLLAEKEGKQVDDVAMHTVHDMFQKRSANIRISSDNDGMVTVTINGDGFNNETAELSKNCLLALNWPIATLDNTKREDIVFIAFQFWVLGMSAVALMNESIPHIFASLLTHVLATGWSGFQIYNTRDFKMKFNRMITNGVCNNIPLLPDYWARRSNLEIPILALNIVSLIISGILTWRLVKLFGWQTFKRVGASLSINRIYKLVLVLSIALQLSFFFIGATVGLWLDDLINGVASQVAWYVPLYKATSVITLVLLVPWLWTGWYAVRQEKSVPMFIFLVLSLLYMGGWSVMFLSDTFRWTFLTWRFFGVISVSSIFLTLCAFVLGVVCRYNFGKGLPRYLNAQEPLPGDDFTTVRSATDVEKVDFPSNDKPIPTFSVAFGSGDEVPPPSQMFAGSNGRLGPRFYNRSAEPFETPSNSPPQSELSSVGSEAPPPHSPIGSIASYYSYSPTDSSFSQKTDTTQGQQNGKRWAIEG